MNKLTIAASKASLKLRKHSPIIFMTAGVLGAGWAMWEAYQARNKVEDVVKGIEIAREDGEEINKLQVAKDLGEALYKPILIGVASIGCILMAHNIQSNRIKVLMGALVTEQARNVYFEHKYKKEHGEEAYEKFVAPVENIEHTEIGKNGKEKVTVESVKRGVSETIGRWFSDSSEYASDDMEYNMTYVEMINDKMNTVLFQRGHLLLNEVYDALGFPRNREGALLGWSSGSFEIKKQVLAVGNTEDGETREQLWVTWTTPRYIHEEVEFNSRYSVYKS
jgi:hypothetical protein